MVEDKQELTNLIHFWESKLTYDKVLLELSTAYIIEKTVKYLKELKSIRCEHQWEEIKCPKCKSTNIHIDYHDAPFYYCRSCEHQWEERKLT